MGLFFLFVYYLLDSVLGCDKYYRENIKVGDEEF